MSKKKWYLIFVLLLVSSLVLASCGGDGVEEPAAQPTEEPVEEPMEEPTEEPMEEPTEEPMEEPTEEPTEEPAAEEEEAAGNALVVWADETRSALLQDVGANFEAEFGVPVSVEQYGFGDIRDQLKVAGPAGEGPDILIGAHDWLGELVINGLLAPVNLGAKEAEFAEAAVQAFTYDGVLYGMPYATENVAFVYNTDLVSEPPTTWEEVREVAAQLEEEGLVEQGYILQSRDPYHFYPIVTAHGGYVFGVDENGSYTPDDVGVDSDGGIEAAQWLGSMVEEGHLQPGYDHDGMVEQFMNGNAAMMIAGPWTLDRLREAGVPYAITTLPAAEQEARPFMGVQGFMISAFSEQGLLAETFLTEYVATEEVMSQLAAAGTRPPAYLPSLQLVDDQDLVDFAAAGEDAYPMPAIPEMSAVWDAWTNGIDLIFLGEEEPDTAFENAADQIRSTIEGS